MGIENRLNDKVCGIKRSHMALGAAMMFGTITTSGALTGWDFSKFNDAYNTTIEYFAKDNNIVYIGNNNDGGMNKLPFIFYKK